MNPCGVIYKITNLLNGKVYIGKTKNNPRDRWNRHCCLTSGSIGEWKMPIKKAIKKYGKNNFSFEVIESCPVDNLNSREIYWISYYKSNIEGYNVTSGGTDNSYRIKIPESEYDKIVSLYNDSYKSLREIAVLYQVDKATIKHVLQVLQVKIRNKTYKYKESYLRDLLESGKSLRTLEKETGISRGYLSSFKKIHGI